MRKRRSKKSTGKGFVKVWFSRGAEKTAGLILPSAKLDKMSMSDVSRLFPMSEAGKMAKYHVSEEFPTWEAAFHSHK